MFYAYIDGYHVGNVSLRKAMEDADKYLVYRSEGLCLVCCNTDLEIYATYGMADADYRFDKPILYRKLVKDIMFKDDSEFSEADIIRCSDGFGKTWCFGPWTYKGKAYRKADIDALIDMVDKDIAKATWYAVQDDIDIWYDNLENGSYDFDRAKRIGNHLGCNRLVAVEDHDWERVVATAYYFYRDGSLRELTDAQASSWAASLYDGGWRASDACDLVAEYHLARNEADALISRLSCYEEGEDA